MLGDVGSIASMAGVVVSLVGLGFAILQIRRLRGETRAAREASEATQKAVRRDLAIADIGRIAERIQGLKELHRAEEWERAISRYPDVQRGLIDIRNRYPSLSEVDSGKLQVGVERLRSMEQSIETMGEGISRETVALFNQHLAEVQLVLAELETRLQQPDL